MKGSRKLWLRLGDNMNWTKTTGCLKCLFWGYAAVFVGCEYVFEIEGAFIPATSIFYASLAAIFWEWDKK